MIRARLALAIFAGIAFVSTPARADDVGYQLNRFQPAPVGDPFVAVEYPWYSKTRWFAGGLSIDYAHNVLGAQHLDTSGSVVHDPAPIAHQLNGRLDLAGSLFDRVALTFSMPFVLYEGGTPFAGVGPSGAAVSDPRIGLRVRAYGQPDSLVSLSFAAYVWAPVGSASKLAGEAGVRAMPRVTVGGLAFDHLRWAANVSFLYRAKAHLSSVLPVDGNTVGSEMQLGLGVQYVGLQHRLSVGPELLMSFAVAGGLPSSQKVTTLELLVGAHYSILDQVLLGLGVGTGLVGAPGPPDARVLFSVAYAPVRSQRPRLERVMVLPDADGHVGGVEVDDGKKKTLLDKAFASTELARADAAPRRVQAAAAPPAATTLQRTLPPIDHDGDGVSDADDACPDQKGVASPDPLRNGCPAASEKVVILPGPDGHVGGVEVDDGKTKIVLDKAYATAEVAADGAAHAAPDSIDKSIDKATAKIKKTLPTDESYKDGVELVDSDSDGIPDNVDACPTREGVANADPLRHGCPKMAEKLVLLPSADGHVGAVDVGEGDKKIRLEEAFGSVEVGEGPPRLVPPQGQAAIERTLAALAAALPPPDRDNDGIPDAVDACPDRPGLESPNPQRNGCPVAVERVVVLPDENGHVGAVEVGEGDHKVLLDKAYASAELGADGQTLKLTAEAKEVSEVFGKAMAAQPPGARIILYFTARSEPARDLTGPIDNLVAELNSRQGPYIAEVIGHTDQTGSERANLRIGLQRAQLIADKLVAAGVPRDHVKASSKGSAEPAVKLKSRRIVEVRNRRVEIWVR